MMMKLWGCDCLLQPRSSMCGVSVQGPPVWREITSAADQIMVGGAGMSQSYSSLSAAQYQAEAAGAAGVWQRTTGEFYVLPAGNQYPWAPGVPNHTVRKTWALTRPSKKATPLPTPRRDSGMLTTLCRHCAHASCTRCDQVPVDVGVAGFNNPSGPSNRQ